MLVVEIWLFSGLGEAAVVVMQIQSNLIRKFRDDLNNEMSKVDMCKFLSQVPKRGCCKY